ncbi:MAG: 50S ribosomal protein L7/L12, partial [Actinomycetota bacterium]
MANKTLSQEDVLEAVANWTVLELSEFVKAFEEKFGVSAAAPVAVAAGPAGGGGEAAAEEEKDEFDVILNAAGDKKIQVI